MPFTLVRRPRPGKVQHKEITDEVRDAYEALGERVIKELLADISEWDEKPEFKAVVKIGKTWRITIKYDRRTRIGKIYGWVDNGTGERGNDPAGQAYDIFPRQAKALAFDVPYIPLSVPKIKPYQMPSGEPAHIVTHHVTAPGITARDFSEAKRLELKDRNNPDGLKRTTDNAVKRGARKIGKKR